jgi:hypothetical protein
MYNIGWGIRDAGMLDEMITGELAELLKSWNLSVEIVSSLSYKFWD